MVSAASPGLRRRFNVSEHPVAPSEGWITVVLHFLIVLVAARTIEREDWADGLRVLTPVAGLAMLNGLMLAKSRVPDLVSHITASLLGIGLGIVLTAATLDESLSWRGRFEFLWDRAELWFRRVEAGRRVDDADLFVLMMAVTVWLVAYSSSWMLYRRRWLVASVSLPGMVIVFNLGYASDSSTRPLLMYTVGALVLAARHFAFRRQVEWTRTRLPSPERLPLHFVRGGLTVALIVALLGWAVPTNAARPLVAQIADLLDRPFDEVEDRWHDLMAPLNGSQSRGGSFATFGDSFQLGGELNLSDEPVASVQADAPLYLIAHRYNHYDGQGWSTDVESTFRSLGEEGEIRAPLITFRPKDGVFLTTDMTGGRAPETAQITVLRPKGDLLLTINTYVASSERASVQVSWRQLLDEQFDVQDTDLGDQPEDLRQLISLLRLAEFEADQAGDGWQFTDPALGVEIAALQSQLRSRFLDTKWEVGPNGVIESVVVTGQLPIYDDVEAVRSDDPPLRGSQYDVTGLESIASADELRGAGTDDAAFVDVRYSGLPTTVTDRTVQLAQQATQDAYNRFDQALAIESYLRSSFAYDEKVDIPPENQDVVDYFLFESRRGYCEYFASAMVVMLRSLDVPARIAAGYRAVPYDEQSAEFLYREKQAHTWVEVYFPGYGWVPFEPTPAAEPFQYGDNRQQQEPVDALATVEPVPTATVEPSPTPEVAGTPVMAAGTEPPASQDRGLARFSDEFVAVLGGLLLIAALFAGVASALWLWRFRGLSPVGAFYARLQRIGSWWGLRPDPSLTPVEFARELGQSAPSMRAPARLLAQLYEAEQYGGRPMTVADTATGQTAWKELRRSIMKSWGRRRTRRGKRAG